MDERAAAAQPPAPRRTPSFTYPGEYYFTADKGSLALFPVICAVIVLSSAGQILTGSGGLAAWCMFLIGCAGLIMLVPQAVFPPVMRIAQDGITVSTVMRSRDLTVAWSDVTRFRITEQPRWSRFTTRRAQAKMIFGHIEVLGRWGRPHHEVGMVPKSFFSDGPAFLADLEAYRAAAVEPEQAASERSDAR